MKSPDCELCQLIRRIARSPFGILRRVYRYLFARPSMQGFNNALLHLALHGKGFNNCCDYRITGEDWFIGYLATWEPRLCLDIGANFGDYSKMLLEKTSADVVAFEPLSATFQVLARLREEFPGRFTPVNKGVGERDQELLLYHDEAHSGIATLSPEVNAIDFVGEKNTRTCLVDVVTLDNFLAADPGIAASDRWCLGSGGNLKAA